MTLSNGYEYAYQWDRGISFETEDADGIIRKMYNQHCKATFLVAAKDGRYSIPDQLFICGKPIVIEVLMTNAGMLATEADDIFHVDGSEIVLIRDSAKPENYIYSEEEIKAWNELSEKLTDVAERLEAVEVELPKKSVIGHNHLFGNIDGVLVVEVTGTKANYKANQIQSYASQNYAIFLVSGGLVYTASSGNGVKVQFTRTNTSGTVMIAEVDYNGNVTKTEYNPVPIDDINANTEARHSHSNKEYLDKLDDDYIKSLGGGGGGNIEIIRFRGDSGGFFYSEKSGNYIAEKIDSGAIVIGYGSPSYSGMNKQFSYLFVPSRILSSSEGTSDNSDVIFSSTEVLNDEVEQTIMLRVTNEMVADENSYRIYQTTFYGGGDSKDEIYTVNCTLDGEDTGTDTNAYRTDKNYYDIENAYNDGMLVVMKTDKYVIPLTSIDPPYIYFGSFNAESGKNPSLERGIMARARPFNIILTEVNIGGSVDASGVSYGDSNVAAALDEIERNKIDEPTTDGTAGQVLTTDGNGGRSWTTPQGGGEWKEGTLLAEIDCSANNGVIELTDLDDFTDFVFHSDCITNGSTDSGWSVYVNGEQLSPVGFVGIYKNATSHQFSKLHYNGIAWDGTYGEPCMSNPYTLQPQSSRTFYTLKPLIGRAKTLKLNPPLAQYRATSGTLRIWGR